MDSDKFEINDDDEQEISSWTYYRLGLINGNNDMIRVKFKKMRNEAIARGDFAGAIVLHREYEQPMTLRTFTKLADVGFTIAQHKALYEGVFLVNDSNHENVRHAILQLIGYTLIHITEVEPEYGNKRLQLTRSDGKVVTMGHSQECCESVWLEDVVGDLQSLIGKPLMIAEVTSNYTKKNDDNDDEEGDEQWTYYRLGTDIGNIVTLRWCGTSNGYYSTDVNIWVK
jgi:hypothetical protein